MKLPLHTSDSGAWLYDADSKYLADFTHGKYTCEQVRKNAADVVAMSHQIESLTAQLAAAQDRLREIEAQEPVQVEAVPVDVAMDAIAHVGSANYQHRQDEATAWVEAAAFLAYARHVLPAEPASQQPAAQAIVGYGHDQHGNTVPVRMAAQQQPASQVVAEPTGAMVTAGADVVSDYYDDGKDHWHREIARYAYRRMIAAQQEGQRHD